MLTLSYICFWNGGMALRLALKTGLVNSIVELVGIRASATNPVSSEIAFGESVTVLVYVATCTT